MSKSKSEDLRLNFTSKIHYQHETLELVMIIKPMDFQTVDLLISWDYIINQKIIEKSPESLKRAKILNL